jgi:hypothetical protein
MTEVDGLRWRCFTYGLPTCLSDLRSSPAGTPGASETTGGRARRPSNWAGRSEHARQRAAGAPSLRGEDDGERGGWPGPLRDLVIVRFGGRGPQSCGDSGGRVGLPTEGQGQMSNAAVSPLCSSSAIGLGRTPSWRVVLGRYARADLRRSLLDIVTSVVPYLGLLVGMYFLVDARSGSCSRSRCRLPAFWCAPTSCFMTVRMAASCRGARRMSGSAPAAACWCSRRFGAGATSTPRITPHRETSTGAASGIS